MFPFLATWNAQGRDRLRNFFEPDLFERDFSRWPGRLQV